MSGNEKTSAGRKKYQGANQEGPARRSPYPMSRLAPVIELVDLAREIGEADKLLNVRVSAKLKVIADQIRGLQQEARAILDEARRDQELNHARCNFQRKPGHVYHLYEKEDDRRYFSMLSPEDWRGNPPHTFVGSFRLENDMSWTPAEEADKPDETAALVDRLLLHHSSPR